MTTLFIILILLGAIVTAALVLAEIFFIPGVGLLGIVGVGGFILLEYYLLAEGFPLLAIIYPLVTIIAFFIGFFLLSRNKFIKKVALTDTVDEVAVKLPEGIYEGAKGEATSRLALVGTIRLYEGQIQLEAESEEGFIDEYEPIYISRISNHKVFVKRLRSK